MYIMSSYACYKVFDQYLHFVSLEEDLFIVRNQDKEAISYYGIELLKYCVACLYLVTLYLFSYYICKQSVHDSYSYIAIA